MDIFLKYQETQRGSGTLEDVSEISMEGSCIRYTEANGNICFVSLIAPPVVHSAYWQMSVPTNTTKHKANITVVGGSGYTLLEVVEWHQEAGALILVQEDGMGYCLNVANGGIRQVTLEAY